MSRKAKLPIVFPKEVEIHKDDCTLEVKGPKGSLELKLMKGIEVVVQNHQIKVELSPELKEKTNFLGLYWSLIFNMVKGVVEGFEKRLEMIGVGFRAAVQGNFLDLQIGLSHSMKMPIPKGLELSVEKNTLISIKGIDKQAVGQFAADVRAKRPPEPYKGKGIRYDNEYVRRKAGKTSKK
ncbi:MAG: 50S ribosomal protein L6 [Chlamydiales bacterium]